VGSAALEGSDVVEYKIGNETLYQYDKCGKSCITADDIIRNSLGRPTALAVGGVNRDVNGLDLCDDCATEDDDFLFEDYDFCYECRGLGDDYAFDENDYPISNCDTCLMNPKRDFDEEDKL
jgi:hypothetical protein